MAATGQARAGAVVLSNESAKKVAFSVVDRDGRGSKHTLDPGDLVSLPTAGKLTVAFERTGQRQQRVVGPNSVQSFVVRQDKLDLVTAPLGLPDNIVAAKPDRLAAPGPLCKIPVKILVDDDEPAVQAVWEKRLRKRLAAASDIFERHCRVRFDVAAVDTWESDNGIRSFAKSLGEFETKVRPAPARLAIGFTGQYQLLENEKHLGGIRAPFHTHILIGEWPQHISEPERLEVLVHELGHYLGAVHVADTKSVMRPKLGDRQSHARSFRIGFDAPNTLAMYLVAEELALRPINNLAHLSRQTKAQLRGIYATLEKSMPGDPAAAKYLALLGAAE